MYFVRLSCTFALLLGTAVAGTLVDSTSIATDCVYTGPAPLPSPLEISGEYPCPSGYSGANLGASVTSQGDEMEASASATSSLYMDPAWPNYPDVYPIAAGGTATASWTW